MKMLLLALAFFAQAFILDLGSIGSFAYNISLDQVAYAFKWNAPNCV